MAVASLSQKYAWMQGYQPPDPKIPAFGEDPPHQHPEPEPERRYVRAHFGIIACCFWFFSRREALPSAAHAVRMELVVQRTHTT